MPNELKPCSGGHPEWHLQVDALQLLKMQWDMILAFPPCTHLAVSGARHFAEKRRDGRQQAAINFFMQFATADCPKIAIENPVGIMSTYYRKPDQIIQPYMFGDKARKKNLLMAQRTESVKAYRHCGLWGYFAWWLQCWSKCELGRSERKNSSLE